MAWVKRKVELQSFMQDFENLLNASGWEPFLRQRLYSGLNFAETRLFQSIGTDHEKRFLGLVAPYNKAINSTFNDDNMVVAASPLGYVGLANGIQTEFNLKVFPVDEAEDFNLLLDGITVPKDKYTLHRKEGVIQFDEVFGDTGDEPPTGIITAEYMMAANAPDPASKFILFTFSSVRLEREVLAPGNILGTGDGSTATFKTPDGDKPLKEGTVFVYLDEDLVSPDDYAVNLGNGTITFITPPPNGVTVSATYLVIVQGDALHDVGVGDGVTTSFPLTSLGDAVEPASMRVFINGAFNERLSGWQVVGNSLVFDVPPATGSIVYVMFDTLEGGIPAGSSGVISQLPDREAKLSFNASNMDSVMAAVYSELRYFMPSPPTVISLTQTPTFERSWQRDSLMEYWGNLNKDRIALFIRLDPAGGEQNAIFAFFYVGRLHLSGKTIVPPVNNMVIIGSCKATDEITVTTNKKLGNKFIDYGTHTSNGNNTVNLMRTLGGIYYQKHYLRFITHDREIDNDDGRFSPSKYTGRHHVSRFGIFHPNDGVVGYLDDVYAVHPKGISQNDDVDIDTPMPYEYVGTGDGNKKIFYLSHRPILSTLEIFVDCTKDTNFTFNTEFKQLILDNAPPNGAEVVVRYTTRQKYNFNLITAARAPFNIAGVSPFTPMGLAILQSSSTAL